MKKILIPLIIIISPLFWRGVGGEAFSQTTDSTKKQLGLVVKTDILSPILRLFGDKDLYFDNYVFSFTVEKLLAKRHSVQLTFFESWEQQPNDWQLNQWSLIPEYKFFVSKKKAHTGYYIGAFGQFLNYNERDYSPEIGNYKTISVGGGISNGVQFYVLKKITIDALLGFGILKPIYVYDTYGAQQEDYLSTYTFRSAISIGYKF